MKNLPLAFIEIIEKQLGDETDKFVAALDKLPPVSIRFNPKKNNITHDLLPITHKIAWSTEGVYLSERPVFTLDPAFHAGAYYVQEASSMFIEEALRQSIDLQQVTAAIDLCGAPGGKTTLLASLLPDDCFLVGNEVIKNRVDILKENIIKWGYANAYVTNHDPEDFNNWELRGLFDIVLVDAPCSGEGLFRKDENAIKEWSPESVQVCAARQKRILTEAMQLVKPDGILLFSTCTYNDAENIGSTEFILQNADFQEVKLDLKPEWHITEKQHGYQFYPHKTEGEGFYCCVFKRKFPSLALSKREGTRMPQFGEFKGQKLPKKQVEVVTKYLQEPDKFEYFIKPNGMIFIILKKHLSYINLIDNVLKRKSLGLEIGEFKGQDFIPSHDLAMSTEIAATTEGVNLPKSEALRFLKKENIEVDGVQGWVLARYEGLNLGWMKVLKNRINNYLPKDFRIRMELPREN